jgi:hypothetical protein
MRFLYRNVFRRPDGTLRRGLMAWYKKDLWHGTHQTDERLGIEKVSVGHGRAPVIVFFEPVKLP